MMILRGKENFLKEAFPSPEPPSFQELSAQRGKQNGLSVRSVFICRPLVVCTVVIRNSKNGHEMHAPAKTVFSAVLPMDEKLDIFGKM